MKTSWKNYTSIVDVEKDKEAGLLSNWMYNNIMDEFDRNYPAHPVPIKDGNPVIQYPLFSTCIT